MPKLRINETHLINNEDLQKIINNFIGFFISQI